MGSDRRSEAARERLGISVSAHDDHAGRDDTADHGGTEKHRW
jgi:hypothetical protein